MLKRPGLFVIAILLSGCKLGPFPDEPVEVPTAPLPDGWIGKGVDAGTAGAPDAPVTPTPDKR